MQWGHLKDLLDTKSVQDAMQGMEIVEFAVDVSQLGAISLDELFMALIPETSFGALAICKDGELGALVFPWEMTINDRYFEWSDIINGVGFDKLITIDDEGNEDPLAIQYNPLAPQAAAAALEWLIRFDKYRKKISLGGPESETSSSSCVAFNIPTTFRRMVLQKIYLNENQQLQLLRHVKAITFDNCLLMKGGKPCCRALSDLQSSNQLMTERIDFSNSIPFGKSAFLELVETLTKIQGGEQPCVIVFSQGAIFDALDKFGKSLASTMASVLARSQGGFTNQVGSDKNNLGESM
jgi:hypothetical protein